MISLDDAKFHLRIDGTQDDAEATAKLTQAEAIVAQYLGAAAGDLTPEADPVKDAAVLLILGELWANRESSASVPLSPSVRGLLDLLRGPTYA